VRSFIPERHPALADNLFLSTRLCWDGIFPNLNFRVCPRQGAYNLFVARAMGSGSSLGTASTSPRCSKRKLGGEWADLWA
jgi:sarcosine oxidase / L-pipecolate oxidase